MTGRDAAPAPCPRMQAPRSHTLVTSPLPLGIACRRQKMYPLVASLPFGLTLSTLAAKPNPAFSYKAYNDAMTYKKLGSSDLLVSSCCMGTMTWGNQNTDADAAQQLNEAWDNRGVNFLDTAECCARPDGLQPTAIACA